MKANLINKRFGRLVVLQLAPREEWKCRNQYWICQCDCGNTKTVRGPHLSKGATKSCGCIRTDGKTNNVNWKGIGDISGNFFYSIRQKAEHRNISFEITLDEIWTLFLKQQGKCALTGLALTFPTKSKASDGSASLDRIDSSKGYILNNVQWVHKDINQMKWDMTQKEFFEYCLKIVTHNKL